MVRRRRSAEMPEWKRRCLLLERILRQYQQWQALYEDEGIATLTIYGEEWHFLDLLNGMNTLPPRQKLALWLIVIEDRKEVDVARMMNFSRWSTPVQQYKNIALWKLLKYHDGKGEWHGRRSTRNRLVTRTRTRAAYRAVVRDRPTLKSRTGARFRAVIRTA